MRSRALGALTALVALVAAPAAAFAFRPTTVRVSVTPRTIGPRTNVVVRFTMPFTTSASAGIRDSDALVLSGPRHTGCIRSSDVALAGADAGTRVATTLRPSRLGGRWCVGVYDGRLVQTTQLACRPGPVRACPQIMIAARTLARFRFRVARVARVAAR